MGPELSCLETRAAGTATKDLAETRRDRDVLDCIQAQQGYRAIDGTDLSGQPVESGIHDLQNPGTECGVGRDDLMEIACRARRILDDIDDVQSHLGERRHVRHAFDDLMCDGL